jgi:hypothetical protein
VNEADALLLRAARGNTRGADAVWAAARQRHRHHPLLLGVALALFAAVVVAVAAVSLATRTTDDSQPFVTTPAPTEVTATATGAQLATSVRVSGPDLEAGSSMTAQVTLTNESDAPLFVSVEPRNVMRVVWGVLPVEVIEASPIVSLLGWDESWAPVRRVDEPDHFPTMEQPTTVPETTMLAPGESTTVVGIRSIDESVRTGTIALTVAPVVFLEPPSADPAVQWRYQIAEDAGVEVPLTVLPRADGTVTQADAQVLALADPEVQRWLMEADRGPERVPGPAAVDFTALEPVEDGWRLVAGKHADDGTRRDTETWRELGLPGFIVQVDRQGAVTVEYMVEGDGTSGA